MAFDNTKNTQTTDSKPEGEQGEPPDPEQLREPSPKKAADEDAAADTEASAGGFGVGAAALVSAGLGLSSLTGTSLSDMLRTRQEIIGQIEAGTGGGGGQIEAFYGAPWHTAALVNGIFALAAVLIGGVLLAAHGRRADTWPWVKAVALGGAALGVIGLVVAGGMYLDLFAAQPTLPGAPAPGTGG